MYTPKTSSHSCLWSVRCVKLRKSRIKSQSDYYDHITLCHLSLFGIPRARFAKVAQFHSADIVPTARPFAVGIALRLEEHVLRRGAEGR